MRLVSYLVAIDDITSVERSAMLELMQRHYANVQPATFFDDLEQKQWAILLYEPQEQFLCGFSTQTLVTYDGEGRAAKALFSGDTIVDRQHWGDPELGHAWGQLALRLIDEHPDDTLDWFLISQGFRTYRYLSLFFREFYPRFDRTTPEGVQSRMASLATQLFGTRFDALRNVIRAGTDSYHLRAELAAAEGREKNPHVAFFLQQNPGHVHGDELCCMAPLTRQNFTDAAWRVIDRPAVVDAR